MSKKHYEAIADVLAIYRVGANAGERELLDNLSSDIADVMAADNPRFNRDRFLRACGVLT